MATTYTDDQWLRDLFGAALVIDEAPLPAIPAPTPKPAAAPCSRYFVRCCHCLTVSAIDVPQGERLPMEYNRLQARCGLCTGPIELMGRVERDRLVQDRQRCACDDRCTSARGPLCVCKCGGKNHGAGILAIIRYTVDAGKVPTITPKHSAPNAPRIAEEYRAALATVRAERDRLLDQRAAGFLPYSEFSRLQQLQRIIQKAEDARTHAGRMKTLRAIS